MSSVTKVSTGWRARWRTPDGKSRSKTFARKIDAEKHLTGTDHAKLTGAYVDPAPAESRSGPTPSNGGRSRCTGRPPRSS